MNAAMFRAGGTIPDREDTVLAHLALACAIHARMAERGGWVVREFDGDAPCHFCVEEAAKSPG